MRKEHFYVAGIFLLFSCGTNAVEKPVEEQNAVTETPTKTETDGVVVAQEDTLTNEDLQQEPVKEMPQKNSSTQTEKSITKAEKPSETKPGKPTLHGSWELIKVYGAKEPFTIIFPGKTPTIQFDLKTNTVSGNNGCNSYNGPFELRNGILRIEDLISTRMYCEEVREQLFMNSLKRANAYRIDEAGKLILQADTDDLLQFKQM